MPWVHGRERVAARPQRETRAAALLAILAIAGLSGVSCGPPPTTHPSSTLRIYLARHGQTDWNLQRKLQGWSDTHLNATGREQALALAEKLRGVQLDRAYSSTLSRSRETAEIARGTAPLESLEGLREQALGKFEGVRLGIDSLAAAEFSRRGRDPDDALDGGESDNQFYQRVRRTIEGIVAKHSSGTILIVGHGGTNKMILRVLLGLPAEQADSIQQANDELYLIEIRPDAPARLWKAIGSGNLADL
jgi:broad specificity phosphatase PhoE